MFSCEFCEISKNTFSYRTPPVAASGLTMKASKKSFKKQNSKETLGEEILI